MSRTPARAQPGPDGQRTAVGGVKRSCGTMADAEKTMARPDDHEGEGGEEDPFVYADALWPFHSHPTLYLGSTRRGSAAAVGN